MAYTTQFGLDQNVADYLNQPMPGITGIFPPPPATIPTPVPTVPIVDEEESEEIIERPGGEFERGFRDYKPLEPRGAGKNQYSPRLDMGYDSNLNQPKSSKKGFWEGIFGSKAAQKAGKYTSMAFSPLTMLASRYDAMNPEAVNYNPMLRGQKDVALRGTDLGGLGFRQDDIGRFVGSADPFADDYNPLQGKNLQSAFGTNDLNQMLRDKLQKLRSNKAAGKYKTKSAMDTHNQREKRILEMLGVTSADENVGYAGTEGGNLGSGVFAKVDQSGKTYGPYSQRFGYAPPEMEKFKTFIEQKTDRQPIINKGRDTPISVPRNPQKPSVKPDRDREPSPHSYSHPGSSRSREMSSPFQYGGRAGYSKGGIVTLL